MILEFKHFGIVSESPDQKKHLSVIVSVTKKREVEDEVVEESMFRLLDPYLVKVYITMVAFFRISAVYYNRLQKKNMELNFP